jgi:hypothetical protein
LTIVGIGASAGGLKALRSFFEALPETTGMAHPSAFHFVQLDLVSRFHRTGLFATTDNVGMFFE